MSSLLFTHSSLPEFFKGSQLSYVFRYIILPAPITAAPCCTFPFSALVQSLFSYTFYLRRNTQGILCQARPLQIFFFCKACVCSSQQIGQLHTDFLHCYLFVIYGAAGQAACQTERKPFQNVFLEGAHKLTQAHVAIIVGQCSTGLIVDHTRRSLFVSAHPPPPQALSTVYV